MECTDSDFIFVSKLDSLPSIQKISEEDNCDFTLIHKDPQRLNSHYIDIPLSTKKILQDLRSHIRNDDSIYKNFRTDMPRCKFHLNGHIIKNPETALNIITKNKNYKDILRLSTASALGIPYDMIWKEYQIEASNYHISDSMMSSMKVWVNIINNSNVSVCVNKILQLISIDGMVGLIGLNLRCNLNDNISILNWIYIPVSDF